MNGYKILSYSGSDPALKPYLDLIYSDFLKTLRFGNRWFYQIQKEVYFAIYKQVIAALLNKPETVVRLAVLADDYDLCIGWCMHEAEKVHYICVKKGLRNQGVGSVLLPKKFNTVTHLTEIGLSIKKKKYKRVNFNPFFT